MLLKGILISQRRRGTRVAHDRLRILKCRKLSLPEKIARIILAGILRMCNVILDPIPPGHIAIWQTKTLALCIGP